MPEPNVIRFPLGFNSKFVAANVLLLKVNPPIVPPSNNTSDPVIWPFDFNLKLEFADLISSSLTTNPAIDADLNIAKPSEDIEADAAVASSPAGTNMLFAETVPSIVTLSVIRPPAIKKLDPVICPDADNINCLFADDIPIVSISNPAIVPPSNNTVDDVIWPDADRIKFLFSDDIPIVLISNPAISPPSNNTLEPVICPVEPFKFNVPPDDSRFVPILNPPIVPSWAVILPVIWAADAVIWPDSPFNLRVPADESKSDPILKPPIVPSSATILPVICAADAVIWPDAPFNLRVPADESKSSPILNPPIVPSSATIFPVIWAFDAVILPDAERIKLLFDDLIPTEFILNPAMVPAVFAVIVFATMSPVIFALDAVIFPDAERINLLFEDLIPTVLILNPAISPPSNKTSLPVIWPESFNLRLLLEDLTSSADKVNPPISPPSNNTLDPVICPEALMINLLLEDLIPTELIVNPAIVPAVFAVMVFAVMSPVILAFDAVIFPEADNISLLLELFIPTESILKLAIVPAVLAVIVFATISPVIFASDAVICPDAERIKLLSALAIAIGFILNPAIDADLNIANPSEDIDAEASVASRSAGTNILFAETVPSIVTPSVIRPPAIKKLEPVIWPDADNINLLFADLIPTESILKFAMVPAVFAVIVFAVISPVICAFEAVIWPEADNIKLLFEDLIPTVLILNPAISPPVNKTVEPVIWPDEDNIKLLLVEEILLLLISNPPISPEVAVTLPDSLTSPEDDKWKLEEEISIFPSDPDTNCAVDPKKNVGTSITNALPEIFPTDCPSKLPSINCNVDAVTWPVAFNLKLLSADLISFSLTTNPAMDADLNIANPVADIDDDAFESVDGDPAIVAGVRILFAVTDPSIVTPSVIVPPSNKTLDAVICPPAFNLSSWSADLISSELTTNPPIDADLNIAKPWSDIDDDAFAAVAGDPPIVAGVNILLADTEPNIVTSSVIVPPSINIFDAVMSPLGCIWYPEEDISSCPLAPLINWVAASPKKNVGVFIETSLPLITIFSVRISNSPCPLDPLVLNLKKLFSSATNSNPTPP